jgi:hypothetical protein
MTDPSPNESSGLTVYECEVHGVRQVLRYEPPCDICGRVLKPVRVFREEDVKPLWEAVAFGADLTGDEPFPAAIDAARMFPAPAEWK